MTEQSNQKAWAEQAEAAIRQRQSLVEFVAHCHPDNRAAARKAYTAVWEKHLLVMKILNNKVAQ